MEIPPTRRWIIKDKTLVDQLIKNGFICQKEPVDDIDAMISFHTQSQEEFDKFNWYTVDCKMEFNGIYTLPDKTVIKSNGTTLFRV